MTELNFLKNQLMEKLDDCTDEQTPVFQEVTCMISEIEDARDYKEQKTTYLLIEAKDNNIEDPAEFPSQKLAYDEMRRRYEQAVKKVHSNCSNENDIYQYINNEQGYVKSPTSDTEWRICEIITTLDEEEINAIYEARNNAYLRQDAFEQTKEYLKNNDCEEVEFGCHDYQFMANEFERCKDANVADITIWNGIIENLLSNKM